MNFLPIKYKLFFLLNIVSGTYYSTAQTPSDTCFSNKETITFTLHTTYSSNESLRMFNEMLVYNGTVNDKLTFTIDNKSKKITVNEYSSAGEAFYYIAAETHNKTSVIKTGCPVIARPTSENVKIIHTSLSKLEPFMFDEIKKLMEDQLNLKINKKQLLMVADFIIVESSMTGGAAGIIIIPLQRIN